MLPVRSITSKIQNKLKIPTKLSKQFPCLNLWLFGISCIDSIYLIKNIFKINIFCCIPKVRKSNLFCYITLIVFVSILSSVGFAENIAKLNSTFYYTKPLSNTQYSGGRKFNFQERKRQKHKSFPSMVSLLSNFLH